MGRFRHPLRNDWDLFRPTLMPLLQAPTAEGAMARAMVALMPAFLDYIEDVRDRKERDSHVLVGITSALANIVAQTIKQKVPNSPNGQREALRVMLGEIERECRKRFTTRGPTMPGLIIPN